MVNSILIGKTIYKLLNSSEELKQYVGEKIFPLVADNDVTFPFIVYFRDGIFSNGCKDGYYEDTVNFSIVTVSNSYIESIEIANIIRKIFEKRRLTEEISYCVLDNIDEDFIENSYVQSLRFSCKMN